MRRETIEAKTDDGLTLRLVRVRPDGPVTATAILLHGLSSNGVVYDLQEQSFAAYLADAGIECFIANLRGAGPSDHPSEQWGIDQYVSHDVPTIIRAVLETSGSDKLLWVGHSMGGILLFFHMMENPDAPITRAVTVGSAIDYADSVHGKLRHLLPAISWIGHLPFHSLSRLNAQVAGAGPKIPAEALNFWRSNVDRALMLKVMRQGFHKIPIQLLQDLATNFSPEGFQRDEGRIVYAQLHDRYQLPTLFMAGSRDGQAPRRAVEATARLLSSHEESKLLVFGQNRGQAEHYGHFDLIMGKNAPQETWPVMLDFLRGGAEGR